MPAPDWLVYLGAATGIAGVIMAAISLRHTSQFKASDLRQRVWDAHVDIRNALTDLSGLLDKSEASRKAVSTAKGGYGSGAMQKWLDELEKDRQASAALHQEFPARLALAKLTYAELEAKRGELYELGSRVKKLAEKYHAAIAADDKDREHLQAVMRDIMKR
jgi:hypothetical protein